MSDCNKDCDNCKIEDFCGISIETLGYARFLSVIEEHDARVRADAIDSLIELVNSDGFKMRCLMTKLPFFEFVENEFEQVLKEKWCPLEVEVKANE